MSNEPILYQNKEACWIACIDICLVSPSIYQSFAQGL